MVYDRIQHSGGAVPTTLGGDITSGATSLNLVSSSGWPDGSIGPFYLVIDPGLANEEKILAGARTSLTLNSLTRGVDGTSPSAHSGGAVVVHCFTAVEADEANVAASKTVGQVTTKGDLLAATGNQALGRVAAGANNTVVMADSAQPTGVKYAKVAAVNIVPGSITSNELEDGTIETVDLADGAVIEAKIADDAVTTAKIAADAVGTSEIAADAVTASELADNAVDTLAIADAAVTNVKLAADRRFKVGSLSGACNGSGVSISPHGFPGTPSVITVQPVLTGAWGANRGYPMITNIDATNVTIQWIATAGSMAGANIVAQFVCFP